MLLATRFFCILMLFGLSKICFAREIKILVLGQSIAANCNEHMFGPFKNVFQIGLTGLEESAADPFVWSDCKKGSVWMPLGAKLIESQTATKVVFMVLAIKTASVRSLTPEGENFERLDKAINILKRQGVDFDYAFWQQGKSDAGVSNDEYTKNIRRVVQYVNRNIKIDKWLIANYSGCAGNINSEVSSAQKIYATAHIFGIFQGPNIDVIKTKLQAGSCSLNEDGQKRLADEWLNAMKMADKNDKAVQRETLLQYFH